MAPVDKEKLRSHLAFVRGTVRRLEQVRAERREAFLEDDVLQAASTRWLQTAVEALIDTANHVIAREGFGLPRAYSETIEILVREGILPPEHRAAFLAMVRFRNRVVHLYDEVGADEIWRILENDLNDFSVFIGAILGRYFADQVGST